MISMKTNYKQNVKFLWILASVAALLFHFDNCLETAEGCYAAQGDMLLNMFILSFPGSVLYFIFITLTSRPYDFTTPLFHFILWGGVFIVGYFQWFWFVPRLLKGQGMTTLGLLQSGASTVCGRVAQRSSSRARKRKRAAHPKGRRAAHFDETGRTPLEIAIGNNHI
jgi:hypothetical protein